MDGNTQTILNSSINRDALIKAFPDLKDDVNFEILSPQTPIYNCIAWAMQFDDRWVDPIKVPGHWWPVGVAESMSPEALIQAFQAVGFTIAIDCKIEHGFDKVILYKNQITDQWTHASRIIKDSVEHSKFGEGWDGCHSINSIKGTIYGVPYCYMKRSSSYTIPTEKLQGNIEVNLDKLSILLRR